VKPYVFINIYFLFFLIFIYFLATGRGLVKTGGNQLALVSWHVPFDPARSAVKPLSDDINQESETDRCGYKKKERNKNSSHSAFDEVVCVD
jgi:hypothetical protein